MGGMQHKNFFSVKMASQGVTDAIGCPTFTTPDLVSRSQTSFFLLYWGGKKGLVHYP